MSKFQFILAFLLISQAITSFANDQKLLSNNKGQKNEPEKGYLLNPKVLGSPFQLPPKLKVKQPEINPFWKRKGKLYKQIMEDRRIIVSVRISPENAKQPERKKIMSLKAAMALTGRAEDLFRHFMKFEQYPNFTEYIKAAKHDEWQKTLFLHAEAFNYQAKMMIFVLPETNKQGQPLLKFYIYRGVFHGMNGVILFENAKRKKTEMSLTGEYKFDKLPFPRFFAEFGLEVVLQRMAGHIRSFLENSNESRANDEETP